MLKSLTVAVLEFLAGTAWTWIITSHLLLDVYRHIALCLTAVGHEIGARSLHLAHIRLALLGRSLGFRCIPQWDERSEKE